MTVDHVLVKNSRTVEVTQFNSGASQLSKNYTFTWYWASTLEKEAK
jgi:hypothetical protein